MTEHPIQGLMHTAMDSIKQMVDVNTVVGDAVETGDGGVIIPVSRVSFGFAAGGGEYGRPRAEGAEAPFGGGSGAGVSVQPVGFLVVRGGDIRLLPVESNATVERLIDMAPDLLEQVAAMWGRSTGLRRAPMPVRATGYMDDDDDERGAR
jgi:sporulation protein YtfJ